MFVRKRDPRFISNMQTEAQRQAALLASSKEQAARQRAENAAKLRNYKAADWTQVSEETVSELYDSEETVDENGGDTDVDAEADAEEEEEEEEEKEGIVERYECIVCRKTFGSEAQMNMHDRSRKHTKSVHVLKRQMEKENKEFDLDRDVRGWKSKSEFTPIDDDEEEEIEQVNDEETKELEAEKKPHQKPTPTASPPSPSPTPSDSDHVTQQQFEARVLGSSSPEDLTESLSNTLNLASDTEAPKPQTSKVGKAKAKRAKRAAQSTTAEADSAETTTCVTCKQLFPSNTKMFNHLRDNPSHAKPVAATGGGKKGKGKGKRK